MQLNRLTLTQFRAFEQATFDFHPGMNLLVGINGVGKSTVLDALRIMLSQVLPMFTASRSKPFDFKISGLNARWQRYSKTEKRENRLSRGIYGA